MITATKGLAESDPTMARLDDQIEWYDKKSMRNQRMFKRIKIVEITSAAMVPFLAALHRSETMWITGALGVIVTTLEGVLHLNQYQQNWIAYRSTSEALKHEKYLFLANAGPYATATDAHALLAERVESTVSQEHAKWAPVQQQPPKSET